MTADEFNQWLTVMGYSGRQAHLNLGISEDTVSKYRKEGTGNRTVVDLACECLWRRTQDRLKLPYQQV